MQVVQATGREGEHPATIKWTVGVNRSTVATNNAHKMIGYSLRQQKKKKPETHSCFSSWTSKDSPPLQRYSSTEIQDPGNQYTAFCVSLWMQIIIDLNKIEKKNICAQSLG